MVSTLEQLGVDKTFASRAVRRFKAGRQAHEARADQAVVKAKDVVNAAAVPRTAA
jgi:glycine/D-amino acid oxidase-like deaminating enzyme